MTIAELNFSRGLRVEKGQNVSQAGLANIGQGRLGFHAPGERNRTPDDWDDPNYRYIVRVKEDGTGTMEMVPQHKASAIIDTALPGLVSKGAIFPINESSPPVAIVGEGKSQGAWEEGVVFLYSLFLWTE